MKALFVAILLLTGADWAFNHGNVTRSAFGGVAHLVGATGEATSDSVFSK